MRLVRSTPPLAAVLGLCAGLVAGDPALAQQQHQGAGHAGAAAGTDPAMSGMHEAHARMDQRMRQAMQASGTTEHHFAAMMVPHHEGAVEMARAALPSIRDPELRRMAEKTMQENQRDAEELRAWLQRHR